MQNVLKLIFALFVLLAPQAARAACASPSGNAGDVTFNTSYYVLQYCDGTSWIAAGPAGSGANGNCSNPTGIAGDITYNTTSRQLQYCNGKSTWIAMGIPQASTGTGCTNPAGVGGDMMYNAQYKVLQYCNNTNWVSVGRKAQCNTTPGDICADGTVYAGVTPDGNVPMYITQCNPGTTWNGTTCSAGGLQTSYANCSSYIANNFRDNNTGSANTYGIAPLDACTDTGFQLHSAAVYCSNLEQDGHSDWYLPSIGELSVIYTNKTAIGNLPTSNRYWSSKENTTTQAWQLEMADGSTASAVKNNNVFYRCTRHD